MVRQRIHTDSPKDVVALLRRLPPAFPDALVELMRWRGCTVEELAEKALISRSTVIRMRNDLDYESNLESVVGICVALQLSPPIYPEMIAKAGHSFKLNERHIAYQQLLPQVSYFGWDIHRFNEELAERGLDPIGQAE